MKRWPKKAKGSRVIIGCFRCLLARQPERWRFYIEDGSNQVAVINNPVFNHGEFAAIKSQAGLNNYKISIKKWVAKTNAVGLIAKAGRYGDTGSGGGANREIFNRRF